MPAYLVTYDLHHGSRDDYEDLYAAIESYGVWARVTESTWIVVTDDKPTDVRDRLFSCMDEQDRLFILKSGVAGAWRNIRCGHDWLEKWL